MSNDDIELFLASPCHEKENSKQPNFWKTILQFFMTDMVAYMRGGMMAR